MICSKCGHRNKEGAIFCAGCGSKIEAVAQTYAPPRIKTKKGGFFGKFIVFLLTIAILAGGSYFGYRYYLMSQMEKQAEVYFEMEEYEKALEIYDRLIDQTNKLNYVNRKKDIEKIVESQNSFNAAMSAAKEGDVTLAIKKFSEVSPGDAERYETAKKEMANLGKQYLSEVNKEIENYNFEYALELIEDYQKILPDSKSAKDLKISLMKKKEIFEEEQRAEEARAKAKEEEEKRIEEMKQTAANIRGSYQTILTVEAHVRSAPRRGNNSLGVLKQGTEVYVYDTKIEANERIWCKVRYYDEWDSSYKEGWISYNTMNYAL